VRCAKPGHGCSPRASTRQSPPRSCGGEILITDGPFTEGKEHLGGFTVVEAEDLDAALGWARKLAGVTTLPVEVRPFQH
jgi:hypothetical protein